MESQFGKHDVPLFTGRLVGLRSFAMKDGSDGILTGVTYAGEWAAGDNEAKCALTNGGLDKKKKDTREDPDHQVAQLDCSCGYYAYFDGNDNEFQHGVNIEGLVEAWGKITIGDKGFRASKARIAALVIPKDLIPQNWAEKALHRLACPVKSYDSHGWSYPYTAHKNGCTLPLFPYPALMDTIIRRYHTARIFNTMDEAREAFPVTPVDVAKEIVEA